MGTETFCPLCPLPNSSPLPRPLTVTSSACLRWDPGTFRAEGYLSLQGVPKGSTHLFVVLRTLREVLKMCLVQDQLTCAQQLAPMSLSVASCLNCDSLNHSSKFAIQHVLWPRRLFPKTRRCHHLVLDPSKCQPGAGDVTQSVECFPSMHGDPGTPGIPVPHKPDAAVRT